MNVWQVVAGVVGLLFLVRVIRRDPIEQSDADPGTDQATAAAVNMGTTYVFPGASVAQADQENPIQGLTRGIGSLVGDSLQDLLGTFDPSNPNSRISRRRAAKSATLRPEDRVPERVFNGSIGEEW